MDSVYNLIVERFFLKKKKTYKNKTQASKQNPSLGELKKFTTSCAWWTVEPRLSVCNVHRCCFLSLFPSDSTHKNARKCQSCTTREIICEKTVVIERVIFLKTATPKDAFCALNFLSFQRHVFLFALVLYKTKRRLFGNLLHCNDEVAEDNILYLHHL